MADQQRLLREVFAAHGGEEIDTQGDSFFVAFRSAGDALSSAVEIQRALAAHRWPEGAEVRVRIGIHTGEASATDERYLGVSVHRAARVGAAAHGGQVLVSDSTRSLVEDDLPEGVFLRDLGLHRLKDIDRPERISQLAAEGLRVEFPPLRGAERVKSPPVLRRRSLLAAVAAGVLAAAVAIPVFALDGGSGGSVALAGVDANAVGVISPKTNRIVDQVEVGATPSQVTVGEGAIWVANTDDQTVSRIDPLKKAVRQTIGVGNGPAGIAVGDHAVWVTNSLDGTVSRIDPSTNNVVQTITVGNGPQGVVFGDRSVWVANVDDSTISRIDSIHGRVVETISAGANELAFGAGALWASDRSRNSVSRIDPVTGNVVQVIAVGNGPGGIAFGAGGAWVANTLDGTVSRIDPGRNSVSATIAVGDGPSAVAVGAGGVWVSNEFGGTIVRIDPRENRVVKRVDVGNRPRGLAVVGGGVLVSVRASGASHRGGTLVVRAPCCVSTIDTALDYAVSDSWFLIITEDGLTGFARAGGSEGTQLVPDLAVSLPVPTDGGRTYTFQLRPNIRYSTGKLVKPADIGYAIERNFKAGSPGVGFYEGIEGAAACAKRPQRCDLSKGIVADAATNRITIHLSAPDPEFLYKLALPFASAVPEGTPARDVGTHPLPATGPYVIASYRPKHLLRLVRNKYFHEWSKAAQPAGYPDEIVMRMGGTPDTGFAAVAQGKADWYSSLGNGAPSAARLGEAKTRFASQVHANPERSTAGFFLNTRVPPFNSVLARRALNYAADRARAVSLVGGPDIAQPTCQILPPNFPGFKPYCPYTVNAPAAGSWTAPDLAKARQLVRASGTGGMRVTVYVGYKKLGVYMTGLLRSLGYRASLKVLQDPFAIEADSRHRVQIGFVYWGADFPAASNFLNNVLGCSGFLPNTSDNRNFAEFCDPQIDRRTKRALNLQATNPQAANKLWATVDRLTADQAPWVPLINFKSVDFLSKRVSNYQYSPQWGMLIDQLWVK